MPLPTALRTVLDFSLSGEPRLSANQEGTGTLRVG